VSQFDVRKKRQSHRFADEENGDSVGKCFRELGKNRDSVSSIKKSLATLGTVAKGK
jgi:hypothetical protein